MFDDELLKGPCCGNEARCEDMKEAMRKDPKLYRIHPDCTAAKGFTEQFKGLCLDAENEASDSESEQKLETSGNVSGDTEKQRKIIQAFGASGGASGPRKRKATSAEEEEPIQNEDEEEAARQAAEEAKTKEANRRKKAEPIERNKAFLSKIPKIICELELNLKQLATKKVKAMVPEKYVTDFSHAMKEHKEHILAFRKSAEQTAGIKDPKGFAKKADYLEDAEKEVTATQQTLKICKQTLHVYLHDGSSRSKSSKS